VAAGEPENKEEYDEVLTDGVNVYISRSMPATAKHIKISLRRWLFRGLTIKVS
jgi:hypothetical protein